MYASHKWNAVRVEQAELFAALVRAGWFAAVHARYLPTPPDLFVLQSQNREHDKTMSAQPETLTRMEEPSCRPVADREPRQKTPHARKDNECDGANGLLGYLAQTFAIPD